MKPIRVRVQNGKIIGDAPPGFDEGQELQLCLADPEDEMTEQEVARLNEALEEAERDFREGRFRPAEDVIAELRAKR